MNTHHLKTHPTPFQAVWDGLKRAELRKNDRDYMQWDTLVQHEWDPEIYEQELLRGADPVHARAAAYTGREITATVTHIFAGGAYGLETGYVMLSIEVVSREVQP